MKKHTVANKQCKPKHEMLRPRANKLTLSNIEGEGQGVLDTTDPVRSQKISNI